jgi:Recombination endonuclease VII
VFEKVIEPMNKIKHSQIKVVREDFTQKQANLCAICGQAIQGNAVLDHDHKTGIIRAVLHRGCNAMLGKIENNSARNQITDVATYLRNAADYIELHRTAQTELLHPTHFTAQEKKERAKARRKQVLR